MHGTPPSQRVGSAVETVTGRALVLRVHGGRCRLVVALEACLEVGSEMTVPSAPACCARRHLALAVSTRMAPLVAFGAYGT